LFLLYLLLALLSPLVRFVGGSAKKANPLFDPSKVHTMLPGPGTHNEREKATKSGSGDEDEGLHGGLNSEKPPI
jgi:hypothetical protein